MVKGSRHATKFGGDRHCGIGNLMVLVCHLNNLASDLASPRDQRVM